MTGRARWVAVVILALAPAARADSIAPAVPHAILSPNNQFVFVHLVKTYPEQEKGWTPEHAAEIRRIRATYPQSGMYRNNGSNQPLWTVDWHSPHLELADDGIHVIRHGPWPSLPSGASPPRSRHLEREALSFFANGKLIRTYQIGELVAVPSRLPRSVSHFQWRAQSEFDRERMQFHVRTHDGGRFTFDVRTGELLSAQPAEPDLSLAWLAVGAGGTVTAVAGCFVWRRRARARL